MNELNINMLSESELKELLEIRTQITRLQQRYDEIISSGSSSAPSVITAPAAPPPPAETKPQPYQTAPVSAGVAPIRPAPTPIIAKPAAPTPAAVTPSRPMAPRPVPVSAKPVTPAAAPRPVAATSAQKAEEAEKIKVDSSVTSNLRQALVQILTTAGKPLPFNSIYSKLQEMDVQLPESKPMLVVRKLLYDKALFDVVKGGLFQIRAEVEIPETSTEADLSPDVPQAAAVEPVPVLSAPTRITQLPQPQSAPVLTPTPEQQPKQASSFNARLDAILNQ